jgi:hypothetical protein
VISILPSPTVPAVQPPFAVAADKTKTKPKGGHTEYLTITLKDVYISSYQ